MEKNIAHPTDARLYETARQKLVALAAEAGIELRQTYARLAPSLAVKIGRQPTDKIVVAHHQLACQGAEAEG